MLGKGGSGEVGPQTVNQAFVLGRKLLASADVADGALDARLLLQEILAIDHADLICTGERLLSAKDLQLYLELLARRAMHEPLSKILGRREFYGRIFSVTVDVLDPRPDTETVIELALGLSPGLPEQPRVLDLGCGSGALICTLLAEMPQAHGVAVDVSPAALAVTLGNAAALGVADRLTAHEGSWFGPVSGCFDLIVSNPPYIPTADIAGLEIDVRAHDPLLALDGGHDGLGCYRLLAEGTALHLAQGGRIIVEVGAGQADDVRAIFAAHGHVPVASRKDLGGHVRALAFQGD